MKSYEACRRKTSSSGESKSALNMCVMQPLPPENNNQKSVRLTGSACANII